MPGIMEGHQPMRRISEMYKRSGGTNYEHQCFECRMFKNVKRCKCLNYELDADWNPNWTACKFFTKDEIEEIQGQMNIFDFVN